MSTQYELFPPPRVGGLCPVARDEAAAVITARHYLRSFPTGWTRCYDYQGAVVVFSISANKNLERYLFTQPTGMRELARLWAPDGHEPNLLTAAISMSLRDLRRTHPDVEAVVSFADPNAGHLGGVYQAASWIYTGQSAETRVYRQPDGTTVARRSFHSGTRSLLPHLPMERLEGKHRYVKPLTRRAAKALRVSALRYPKQESVAA